MLHTTWIIFFGVLSWKTNSSDQLLAKIKAFELKISMEESISSCVDSVIFAKQALCFAKIRHEVH